MIATDQEKPRAAVVGLGRFGTFWAELLTPVWEIRGTSRRTVAQLPHGVTQVSLEEALASAPVVFLTVSISALPAVLHRIAPLVRHDATIVDTCSVKQYPVEQMQEHLPESVDIVATHPMFGPDSARERRDSLPMIVWPVRDNHQRYHQLCSAFQDLGMRIVTMSPEDHDREAAFTQGVTHLVGRVLRAMELKESGIGTLGYTRLLQVMEQTCNDPVQLFQDLQRYNRHTRAMRRRFLDALHETEKLLEAPDSP